MPHDCNNQPLSAGDKVILRGTIKAITSDQPEYCNITFRCDRGMAPQHDVDGDGPGDDRGYDLALSARMVEKIVDVVAETPKAEPAPEPAPEPVAEEDGPAIPAWQSRLLAEKAELDGRIEKLSGFIQRQADRPDEPLTKADMDLLKRQREAMLLYSAVLTERIAKLGL